MRVTEHWRVGELSNPAIQCPEATGVWREIDSLQNYTINGSWEEIFPSTIDQEPSIIFSDSPEPPEPSPWLTNTNIDNDHILEDASEFGDGLLYEYDLITALSLEAKQQPAIIKNWTKTINGGDPVTCPDLNLFQSRNTYEYIQMPDYPVNVVENRTDVINLPDAVYAVFDENGSRLPVINGWVKIPALHHVKIVKQIDTSNISVNSDTNLLSPDSITDYGDLYYDEQLNWNISKRLKVTFMFDPNELSESVTLPVNSREYSQGSRVLIINRND